MTIEIGLNLKNLLEVIVLTAGLVIAYLGWLKS